MHDDLLDNVLIVDENNRKIVSTKLVGFDRFYHSLEHILEMWEFHKRYRSTQNWMSVEDDAIIATAIFYHDAVYDPKAKRGKNETDSSDLFKDHIYLEESFIQWSAADAVDDCILATRDHMKYLNAKKTTKLTKWFLNLDLLRLGVSENSFYNHNDDLRREYQHLSYEEWNKGQAQFLCSIMMQPKIYTFDCFSDFEYNARCNMALSISNKWSYLDYLGR